MTYPSDYFPDRDGYITSNGSGDKPLSDLEFLHKALESVRGVSGLAHVTMFGAHGVCALGALVRRNGGCVTLQGPLPRMLQQFNDSMPEASPQERRDRVILWLNEQLTSRIISEHI
jgi:hypothetical protein